MNPVKIQNIPVESIAYQPLIFDPNLPEDAARRQRLIDTKQIWQIHDTLEEQIHDLIKVRNPRWRRHAAGIQFPTEFEKLTDGVAINDWGRWVYYPWSGVMVHLLPPKEFRELRLNRNQYKITVAEQERLAQCSVGIVGLSIGNAVAHALIIEELCGHLRLADFDRLDLSNMNRIRAGIQDIGLPKIILAARQIYEINPYASLSLVHQGLTSETMVAFLLDEPKLQIVIDECDDLRMKILMREKARSLRLPVVMETSDRGMLDIERFDQEPDRPIFHGLIGDIRASDIGPDLSNEEKVRFILPIVGAETMSTRMAASMVEIEETISTWPQLGSEVILGGATVAAAVRKIALNQELPSGRTYIDLQAMLTPPVSPKSVVHASQSAADPTERTIEKITGSRKDLPEFMQFVISQGTLAPSGGNAQPWKFYAEANRLWLLRDQQRSQNLFDRRHRAAYVALGAAIKNVTVAAAQRGYQTQIEAFPLPENPEMVAALTFAPDQKIVHSPTAQLFPLLAQRVTNRRIAARTPLQPEHGTLLGSIADEYGCNLQLLTNEQSLVEVGEIVGECDRIRFLCPALHCEMMAEMRWTAAEVQQTRDGIDLLSMELTESQKAGVKLLSRPEVASYLRQLDAGQALAKITQKTVKAASAFGLLSVAGECPADILRGGQAMQHLWLKATELGLVWQPMTVLLYILAMVEEGGVGDLQPNELASLANLRQRLDALFPPTPQQTPLMLFRLAQAAPPTVRSLRLSLNDVLLDKKPF